MNWRNILLWAMTPPPSEKEQIALFKSLVRGNNPWQYIFDRGAGQNYLYNPDSDVSIFIPYDTEEDNMGFFEEGNEKAPSRWQVQAGNGEGTINDYFYTDTYEEAINLIKNTLMQRSNYLG